MCVYIYIYRHMKGSRDRGRPGRPVHPRSPDKLASLSQPYNDNNNDNSNNNNTQNNDNTHDNNTSINYNDT